MVKVVGTRGNRKAISGGMGRVFRNSNPLIKTGIRLCLNPHNPMGIPILKQEFEHPHVNMEITILKWIDVYA